jgi:RND superfamily putative drug exporter
MRRIAEFVLRHRRLVLVGWAVLLVVGAVSAGAATKRLTIDFSLPGQPGTQAAQRILDTFGSGGFTDPTLLTVTAPPGQVVTGHEKQVEAVFQAAVRTQEPALVPGRPPLRLIDASTVDPALTHPGVFRTKDDRTAYALVVYPFYHLGKDARTLPSTRFAEAARAAAPAGWTVGATGEFELQQGDSKSSNGPGVLAETMLGGVGALLVLVFVFASFLALLPLVVAVASILLSFTLLLPVTHLTTVSFIVEFLIALVGLGVAIDYSLLLVNRWREERDHGRDNHDAVVEAMEHAGRAVAFSGATVAIGLLSMILLPVPFMRSIGIGGALIPLASVLTTLTLTPAILGGIGPRVDWPKLRHENVASRSWTAWARVVVRHRLVAAGLGMLALGALFSAFLGIKIGQADSASLARTGPAYTAWQQLKDGGLTTGSLTPIQVMVKADHAAEVAADLRRVGITSVLASTSGSNLVDGRTVLYAVPPQETVNSAGVHIVRKVIAELDGNPAVLGITGDGAAQIDFLHAVYGNFPYMLAFIAVLTFVLLARGFRSVLLPLKAVVLNLLTLAATLGFMVLFWQHGFGSQALFGVAPTGAVTFWIPLMVFAFLFGLSMDYEVFILSRIREEYDQSRDTDEAVVEGIARTGRLVTSAALILFLAFLALATGPGTDLKLFATALGFGILLDATIVRSVLVPALVSLFGEWNWWMPHWFATALRVRRREASSAVLAD